MSERVRPRVKNINKVERDLKITQELKRRAENMELNRMLDYILSDTPAGGWKKEKALT